MLSQQNPWQFLVNLNLLSGRSTANAKCQCKVSMGSQFLKKTSQASHLFPRILPFLQPFVSRVCAPLYRCAWGVAAGQESPQGHCSRNGSSITSPPAPLPGVTSQLPENTCCQHLLSSLRADKVLNSKSACYLTCPHLQLLAEHSLEVLKQFIATIKVMCHA